MNLIVANVLLNTIKIATSGKLMDATVEFVEELMDFEISGEEKRKAVLNKLKYVGGELQPIVAATAGYILSLAVEIAVAYIKAHAQK